MTILRSISIFIVSFVFAFVSNVIGAEDIISVQATGYGSERNLAVNDACIQACKQVNGFLFETEASRTVDLNKVNVDTLSNETKESLSVSAIKSSSQRNFLEQVRGAIKGYDEISCEKELDGQWKAVLNVKIVQYKTPGFSPESRRKLVVAPFSYDTKAYKVGTQLISAESTRNKIRDKVEELLVQSRRFTILGRQDTEAILSEKQFIIDNAGIDEYAKIGVALGTDYLVCGKISNLVVILGRQQSLFTDSEKVIICRAYIKFSYRIIVMPTGQIKWADEVTIDLTSDQCLQLNGDTNKAYYQLINSASKMLCEQALGNIYPVRVVRLQGNGQAVLNQGGALRRQGELLDVYLLGDIIVDPYSKESLGRDENWVARLNVSRVEAKLSYADIIDGEIPLSAVANNLLLCRPVKVSTLEVKTKPSKELIKMPTSSEGIRLPFDR